MRNLVSSVIVGIMLFCFACSMVSASMVGAQIGDWVVMFSTTETPMEAGQFQIDPGIYNMIIADLPNVEPDVYVIDANGVSDQRTPTRFSADSGLLYFYQLEVPRPPDSDKGSVSLNVQVILFSIDLAAGGNMISFPLQPLDTSRDSIISDIVNDINEIWMYDSAQAQGPTLGWFWYYPSDPGGSNMPGQMQSGIGYWFEMENPATLTISGKAYQQATETTLRAGGNLVGYNSRTDNRILQDCITPEVMSCINEIWTYDPTQAQGPTLGWFWYYPSDPGGSNLTHMNPGIGYWIEANSDVIWRLEP